MESAGSGAFSFPDYVDVLVTDAAAEAVSKMIAFSPTDDPAMFVDWGEASDYPNEIGRSAAAVATDGINPQGDLVLETEELDTRGAVHSPPATPCRHRGSGP